MTYGMPISRRLIAAVTGLFWALTAAHGALATASAWDRTDVTEMRLVAAQGAIDQAGSATLGLHVRLAPKWKIYWRTPGDAGFPPRIDWSGSRNLDSAEIAWPAPTRFFEIGDLVTHGYMDEVVLPITVRTAEPGRALNLRAVVDYVACEEICIPLQANLALDLPAGAAAPTVYSNLIARFMARVPGPPSPAGPAIEAAEVAGAGADRMLRVVARSTTPFVSPDLFVEGPGVFYFATPEVELRAQGTEAVFRIAAPADRIKTPLVGVPLTFTLADGERVVEQTLATVAGAAEAPKLGALATILALALVAGLILNLMPCVLPVLSLKLMGVIGMGGAARGRVVTRFVATAGGIVVSFLVLAAAAAGLKAAGQAVSWGIQFQEPLFLVALVVVLTLFASNLWSLFEIPLPAWARGLGGAGEARDSVAGHFLSGAFATVLATPCTAPFLGTALGFALARGTGEIFAVFAALGLGMAAPFLVVAAFPGMAMRLPRPGPWMANVRRVLGFLLAATAVWLLTVLAAQSGAPAALAVAALMAAAVAVLWFARGAERRWRVTFASLGALFILAFVAPGQISGAAPPAPATAADAVWRPFDRDAIPAFVAAGKTVFVDVTAEWCVTCRFNKTAVLDRGEVARRLANDGVVAMRADWTRPDPAIAAYLEDFGRFGIPFNVVYGPALPRGLALPELLSEAAVLTAFDRAGSTLAAAE